MGVGLPCSRLLEWSARESNGTGWHDGGTASVGATPLGGFESSAEVVHETAVHKPVRPEVDVHA